MKKKLLVLVLSLSMVAAMMTGCGKEEAASEAEETVSVAVEPIPEEPVEEEPEEERLERNEPWKDFPIDPETGYAKDPNTGYLVDTETGAVVAGLDEIPSETSSEAGSEEPSAEKQE